jgi:cell division protein FtsB
MSLPKPNRSQVAVGVAAVIAVAVVGGLAWGFGQQLVLARQMRQEERRLEQLVAAEQARHDELVAQSEYVGSDEYVEHWARAEAKMARPGEVAVVVLTDSGAGSDVDVEPTPTPEPEARSFWATLRELILGLSDR